MINYKMKIDCQNEKVLSSDLTFVTGDVMAYRMTFEFYEDDKPMDVTGCTLVVRAKRADGKCIEGAGEISDGKGVFVPGNSMYAIPGELKMEIALCDSSKSYVTTKVIVAEVIEGIGAKNQSDATEVSVFVTLLSQVQARIDAVNRLAEESIPVRGEDYWTDEDKQSMIADVLAALPAAEEVAY
ncbi:MAG: hypothetical protein J6R66_02815 [Clostridia bacterium]|nr:hypothetical protein [Clostridia bacterium]